MNVFDLMNKNKKPIKQKWTKEDYYGMIFAVIFFIVVVGFCTMMMNLTPPECLFVRCVKIIQ